MIVEVVEESVVQVLEMLIIVGMLMIVEVLEL